MNVRQTELDELMGRALDGNAAAYDRLLRLVAVQLRGYFRHRVASEDSIEDLVQETIMAIHGKRSTYDRARPFSPWMYAIARHKLTDYFRRYHRPGITHELDENSDRQDFESAIVAVIDVHRLLDTLTPKQRNTIRATQIEGLSIVEAASAAGIGQSDAKMSLYRGMRRMSARVQGKVK